MLGIRTPGHDSRHALIPSARYGRKNGMKAAVSSFYSGAMTASLSTLVNPNVGISI